MNSSVPVEIIHCNNTLDTYMYSSREANLHIEISVTNLQSLTSFRAGDVNGIVNSTLDYRAEFLFFIGNKYYRVVDSRVIRAEIISLESGKQFILKITNLENSFESIVVTLLMNIRVRIYFVESGLDYEWMFADYTLNIHYVNT